MEPTLSNFFIQGGSGACKRLNIRATEIRDGKARSVIVSQHNTREGAERKLAKLQRAAAISQPQT